MLLLGLIAMLAIVPPIIRGKLEGSPLASTQSFQRSMQEMANSIDPVAVRDGTPRRDGAPYGYASAVTRGRPRPAHQRISRRSSAAVRRGRIMMSLMMFAATWGAATLVSGKSWCLVIFAIACCLLVIFWGMALIIPNMASRPHVEKPPREKPSRAPGSQAL